ncbi:Periplasmic component of amino acid ABC-type transporter/signal transduction system (modular protein) [Frankia canadensis]|uniref:Periplasmic component of amino acid ABC-type transporter/signal transduction system (Modular protein) n=1 Tax=Frankia canadensis TaxID=1836972 RepID=A0A2I2L0Q9_9ACTN|nr:transporter substrate-binding domain-containing protein [Frankia canadensis]SNQ51498.1 Periplasmic component of amino acid ABC-type transporter/signal transduction system (modular protein) [Frankia canadensis]SOU58788.1 Periplasmic component of amino acid ABC-type transporter/signal transduction system (modular protein) [Frankia canadensis]
MTGRWVPSAGVQVAAAILVALTGFKIDLAKEVGRALFGADGHVRFRAVTPAERINVVQQGEVDLSAATITVTCACRAQVDFSAVYFQASKNVLVLGSSPYRELADLSGRKACAASGTTSLQRIVDTPTHPVPYPVANVTDCLVALQRGLVEGVVNDNTVLAGMAAQDPETRIAGPSTLDVPTAIAVSKAHPELTVFVNGVLERLAADGTWARLYAAHGLDHALGPAPAPPTSSLPELTMRDLQSRLLGAGVLAAGLALVGGCATVSSRPPAAARPLAPLATTPVPAVTSAASVPGCVDPEASWRPPASLPAPGAMPAGSFMAAIVRRGYLRVGVLGDAPPFGSINPRTGQAEGFDVDLAEAIGRALFGSDGHVRLRTVTLNERVGVVRGNDVDLVVATMTVNCQRRTQVDFSAVYYRAQQRLLVQEGSGYRELADLGGKKVCAAAGTTSLQRIAHSESRPQGKPRPLPFSAPNDTDCLVALQQGRVDAVSTDDSILAGMAAQDPHLRIIGRSLEEEPDAIAVSLTHPELTRFVNGVLAGLEADGTWAAIYHRWLGTLGDVPAPPAARYRD